MNARSKGAGMRWVGRAIRRLEDPALVSGRGRFTADLPAAHWVRFVRSPYAAGRIGTITAPPGARLVTAADLKGVQAIRPLLHKFNYRPISQAILAEGVVRFVGEPVAAVVGRSEAEAEDIAETVTLTIAPTAPVVDAHAALAAGAPQIHAEAPGNVAVDAVTVTPDFAAAWASAHHIVRVTARSRRQNATPLETRAGHAAYDAMTDRVTLTCTTQMPHLVRTAIADLLGMPEASLRVIAPDVGGGFGQKMALAAEYALLVWLARAFKSTVAWHEDRRENLIAGFHARDQEITLEAAFGAEARLIALKADVVANTGAYSCYPSTCGIEPLMAMAEMPGPYDFRAYSCRARAVVTNTCPMAPYRGVSRPVITLALERAMDKAAALFCLEPVEIRRRNLIDAFPYTSVTGLVFDQASYQQTLAQAIAAIDLPAFRTSQQQARAQGSFLGIGFATISERTGYGSVAFAARGAEIVPGWETAIVSVDPSGGVEARIGASPHGQGLRTTLAQIIADELGVTPDGVHVVHGDTDSTPYGWGTFASRSLVLSGGATLIAARKLRAKLLRIAGALLEASAEDIVLEDGQARVAGTDRALEITTLTRAAYTQAHRFAGMEPGLSERCAYDPAGTFSNACHVAVVEVDIETGAVEIKKFLVAEDAGRLINPLIADGQICGGVAQGIGNALFEEIAYAPSGDILSASLADYLQPTLREVPSIELHHRETLSVNSITKAKGLGEGGAIGAPAAIINAVNDALAPFGVVIDDMPATPQRIRAALRAKGKAA